MMHRRRSRHVDDVERLPTMYPRSGPRSLDREDKVVPVGVDHNVDISIPARGGPEMQTTVCQSGI